MSARQGDAFEIIDGWTREMDRQGGRLAPAFVFVDPFGFKRPGTLLRRLLACPRVELFVNVMWRELDMAISQAREGVAKGAAALADTLDAVFTGGAWRAIAHADADTRADQCAALLTSAFGARWGTHVRMRDNGRARYFLQHFTSHDAGRDLMKRCVWESCPAGDFAAYRSDNPLQRVLIEPEPNLMPLREWVEARLAGGPRRWQELAAELREALWLPSHLKKVLREMREEKVIDADDFTGAFGPTRDPLLRRSSRKPSRQLTFDDLT